MWLWCQLNWPGYSYWLALVIPPTRPRPLLSQIGGTRLRRLKPIDQSTSDNNNNNNIDEFKQQASSVILTCNFNLFFFFVGFAY